MVRSKPEHIEGTRIYVLIPIKFSGGGRREAAEAIIELNVLSGGDPGQSLEEQTW